LQKNRLLLEKMSGFCFDKMKREIFWQNVYKVKKTKPSLFFVHKIKKVFFVIFFRFLQQKGKLHLPFETCRRKSFLSH